MQTVDDKCSIKFNGTNDVRGITSTWSATFQINFGVRQGSVLAPFLFAVYLDDLTKLLTIIILNCMLMTFFYYPHMLCTWNAEHLVTLTLTLR